MSPSDMSKMMHQMIGPGPGTFVLWVILVAVVVLAAAALTVAAVWRFGRVRPAAAGGNGLDERRSPIDVLKDRYALGEIDHEDLERRLERLVRL